MMASLVALATFSPFSIEARAASAALPSTTSRGTEDKMPGLHDFDFLIGEWQVHHRRLKGRLVGSHEWIEFDGSVVARKVLGGYANMDENVLNVPGDPYRAITLRAFDAKTGQWSIWWLDGRTPGGSLEPAMKGSFKDGVGTFYADDTLNGKPIRVRFLWSHEGRTSCHWEQAFSPDNGITWETNWVMQFDRVQSSP
jgi:hypothetical protein